jgi:xylan 1,4-beta-xylosidase
VERTFTNPVLPGFHADPSICRVGDDYFLAVSSFEYFPGVPLYHSRDLVHWRRIGHALTRRSQLDLDGVGSSLGIYAPTLRHCNGMFYMVTTLVGGRGNFYVTASDPAGPWSDPVWLDADGADPSLFFDADGTVYYTRQAEGRDGYIGVQELNLAEGRLQGGMSVAWRGTGGIWPEGPHIYKVGGDYHLLVSEGGTSYEHCLTVARSRAPRSPFESNPANPILTHRDLPEHPFHALGHGDFVETPDGWWMVCLGIRPHGGKFHHLGRETFLAPVEWTAGGWPVINGGRPLAETMPAPRLPSHPWPEEPARDDFDAPAFHASWQHVRNPDPRDYSLGERPGWLRLCGSATTLSDMASPTFVGRAQTAFHLRATTRLDFLPNAENEEAGLALRGNERNHCELGVRLVNGERRAFLRAVLDGITAESMATIPDGDVILSIEAQPLLYEFFCQPVGGELRCLGELPTKALSTEVMSAQKTAEVMTFTGVYVGLYAMGNGARSTACADFDWFDFDAGPR